MPELENRVSTCTNFLVILYFLWAVRHPDCWYLRQCLDTSQGLGSLRINAHFTGSFAGASVEQKLTKRLICVSDFFNQFILNQNRVQILFKNLVLIEISIADLGSLDFYFDRSPEKPILLQSISLTLAGAGSCCPINREQNPASPRRSGSPAVLLCPAVPVLLPPASAGLSPSQVQHPG